MDTRQFAYSRIARTAAKTTGRAAGVAVLIAALGCEGGSPPAPSPAPAPIPASPTPPPTPAPTPMPTTQYRVTGTVTDEGGTPIAGAEVRVIYDGSFKSITALTTGNGSYGADFESVWQAYDGNAGVVGVVFVSGDDTYEHQMQSLPSGPAPLVSISRNLRLRRIRTIDAGQSIAVSVEADSPLDYDGDTSLAMTHLREVLHVRVDAAGTLTIAARPQTGGTVPSVVVNCLYVTDNCEFNWVDAPSGSGRASLRVNANSRFEVRLVVPRESVPQRYEVATSLTP